ncbi:MAG: efflux RND transporter periplasmic adaptor subunit [Planctomycetota bacterium]
MSARAGQIIRTVVTGVLVPLLLIAAAVFGATKLIGSAPRAERHPPERRARLVSVTTVRGASAEAVVAAQGTVKAARSVAIQPRVSGEIVEMAPELSPGGIVARGGTLAKIDDADFHLAVAQRKADLLRAESDLAVEKGMQDVARDEYEMLGLDVDKANRELVLREPQLAAAHAKVASAQAALDRAKLDLARTTVRAPFNAIVRDRAIDVGAQVSSATRIATLEGTDEFWIEVVVPVDRLRWIRFPKAGEEAGAVVRVRHPAAWGEDRFREGAVLRLTGDLEEAGRMARVLVTVADPLSLTADHADSPPLLLGSYVRVEIAGRPLTDTIALDRSLLREGDRVWVMTGEGKLEIRPVTVLFRDTRQVYVSKGLAEGERVVTTNLTSPVDGMPLRTADAAPAEVSGE